MTLQKVATKTGVSISTVRKHWMAKGLIPHGLLTHGTQATYSDIKE